MDDIGLISIVMAAYNAEQTIKKAVQSVVDQSYQNWELLVINDCSTDNTVEVVNGFNDKRIKGLNNHNNCGVSLTRHHGFAEAKGEWIAILDSDDAWMPTKLEEQVRRQKATQGKLLFTGSTFMDSNGQAIDWTLHVPEQITYKELLKQNLMSNSSVLVRRDLLLKNEVLNDGLHEDFACWLKLLSSGEIAYGIDKPLLVYRISHDSKSGNKIKSAKMNWNTYHYLGLSVPAALYNMFWYTFNGLKKYKNLK